MLRTSQILSAAEDAADIINRKSKRVLPHLAHFLLVLTFFEDGLRMLIQWDYHRDFIDFTWDCGYYVATSFVLINFLTQFIGSLMIAVRYHVKLACGFFVVSIVLQTIGYNIFKDGELLIRMFSLVGSLLLLFIEGNFEARGLFAGLPSLGNDNATSYLQLTGRILVPLMFVTILRLESGIFQIVQHTAASIMMILVALGYKTKLSALLLSAWLFTENVYSNAFWMSSSSSLRDSLKYDFFQTMSVIGGLILIVSRGPGDVSIESRKKLF